ncbi:MAG TPA: hypothetical protein PKK13_13375 [Spirochaetota bacterium]|nr:hypothetical protein [Spirochaetota bacterium]
MVTYTIDKARTNLKTIIKQTIDSHEEVNIASDIGGVVMLSENDYDAMKETLKLVFDKKSLISLLESHKNRDNGIVQKSYSIEEVFHDL